MATLLVGDITMTCRHGGDLLPWIGPAFRGVVARQLKNLVCVHPPAERDTRWVYCDGCPHLPQCIYGSALETAPGADVAARFGDNGVRALVFMPQFPAPSHISRGEQLRCFIKWIDPLPQGWPTLLKAIRLALGEDGIGPDRITFGVTSEISEQFELKQTALPLTINQTDDAVCDATVNLITPLVLTRRNSSGHRITITEPTFDDLFRASVRTLRQIFALSGSDLRMDWPALQAASRQVRTIRKKVLHFLNASGLTGKDRDLTCGELRARLNTQMFHQHCCLGSIGEGLCMWEHIASRALEAGNCLPASKK